MATFPPPRAELPGRAGSSFKGVHSCAGESHVGGLDDGCCNSPGFRRGGRLSELPPPRVSPVYTSHVRLRQDPHGGPSRPSAPPAPPPAPPIPPGSPPPVSPNPLSVSIRYRDEERDYDPDCEPVDFATCREVVALYAQRNPGHLDAMTVSMAACEGTQHEADCFLGCSYGAGRWTFCCRDRGAVRPVQPQEGKYSDRPICACRTKRPSSFDSRPASADSSLRRLGARRPLREGDPVY